MFRFVLFSLLVACNASPQFDTTGVWRADVVCDDSDFEGRVEMHVLPISATGFDSNEYFASLTVIPLLETADSCTGGSENIPAEASNLEISHPLVCDGTSYVVTAFLDIWDEGTADGDLVFEVEGEAVATCSGGFTRTAW